MQTTFDKHPAVDETDVFLAISKAFNKIWNIGILLKLRTYGIGVGK